MGEKYDILSDSRKAEIFVSLIRSSYEALFLINTDSGQATTIYAEDEMWKQTLRDSFDFEPLLRRYILNVSVDTDPEAIIEGFSLKAVADHLQKHPVYSIHYTVRCRGELLCFKRASFIRLTDGNLAMTIRDLSSDYQEIDDNVTRLEHALSEAQQQISQKNAFLAMLNENLRTPLYSIMSLSRIAVEEPYKDSFDDYLHKISISGSYMQETIDDVLSLRQIASHQIQLNPVIVHLRDFFANIERMIRPSISIKGLLFESDTSNVADIQVEADYTALQQTVLKMLRSAIGYTVRGGRIRLYARTIMSGQGTVSLEISVENRGIVIDQERLSVLFKPYDYLEDRLSRQNGDLDIALIILRSNLLAMGCDIITAESDEQRGTRISVTLRLPLGSEPDVSKARIPFIPRFDGKRVLVVDDNEISLDVSEKLLRNKGIEVVKARSGKEAISEYVQSRGAFDLILMDILMPEMNGLEATKRIRSMASDIRAAASVPIIALTVNAFRQNFQESLDAGMNEHIVKPIDPDTFYRILMKYLQ